MSNHASKAEKLSTWTKIGYGLGDIYGGGSGVVISFYYLIFLTDVLRINPALAGTVILISKVYDAITDPLEGILADRTRTRWGRRRRGQLRKWHILVLRVIFAAVPIILLALALVFARKYPLTSQVHQQLNRVLADRRANEVREAEDQEEAAELTRLLIGAD